MDRGPSIIIHGGAGSFGDEHAKLKLPLIQEALHKAWDSIKSGQSAEIACCSALRVLEDSEYFNAGYGGYPNKNGIVLLDVGLMRGNGDFVSLLNVRKLKYPSSAALHMLGHGQNLITVWTQELMEEIQNGDPQLKEECGLVNSHNDLIAPFVVELMKKKGFEVSATPDGGTVGCVVRDAQGHICAGTSTGGTSQKSNGRIGDSPIIGAGVYADDEIGGLSTTGHGESFLRVMFSGFLVAELRRQLRVDLDVFEKNPRRLNNIVNSELQNLRGKAKGRGAVIVMPRSGQPTYGFIADKVSIGIKSSDNSEDIFVDTQSGDAIRI
jgi:beta-aspartyl-peptidase (threonine type)